MNPYQKPLTEKEQADLPKMVRYFQQHRTGADKAMRLGFLLLNLQIKIGMPPMNETKLKRLIYHLRREHLPHLVATRNGVYLENDPVKLQAYRQAFANRARGMLLVANGYDQNLNTTF